MSNNGASVNKVRAFRSVSSVSRFGPTSPRKESTVYSMEENGASRTMSQPEIDEEGNPNLFTAKRMLLAVWMGIGLLPVLLQARSYLKFVTPHKLSQSLNVVATVEKRTADMEMFCPLEGLVIAGAWWNVGSTHYYEVEQGKVCHFVVPQYNIHGAYILGTELVPPSETSPLTCSGSCYDLEYYFYHGSIGYYAFYEEAVGTFCANDNIGYVTVRGLGTYDSNGVKLANDIGDASYRRSYWYGLFGSVWILYRFTMLRRSYISCKRYGRRCNNLHEPMRFKDAVVYVQESMRLSAHGASNYHRAMLLNLLVEGLMSDLFMLIAQDGFFAKVQYISLGYNLSGVLSMLFEMVETMNWMGEKPRCLIKRLLFNYETALLGELACAAAMQYYLTGLNQSSLKDSKPVAEAVSYYIWSLVGHGIIVLGIVFVITSIRALGALISAKCTFGSFSMLLASCCVDAALGPKSKMLLLSGYVWEDGRLCYKADTLKAFGIMKMVEEDGAHFLILNKLHCVAIPRSDLIVLGQVNGHIVTPCTERSCTSIVSMFGKILGGSTAASSPTRLSIDTS